MDKLDISGRVAVVTGAASGQGRATALRLARAGAAVAAIDVSEDGLDTLGDEFLRIVADVSDERRVGEAFAEVERLLGPTFVLAAAAAVISRPLGILELPLDEIERVFRVNTFGPLYCISHAVRQMVAAGSGGRVVLWSSIAAGRGQVGDIPYSGSKAAIEGMARPLAAELVGYEITVNVISPGAIDTPMIAGADLTFYDSVLPGRRIGQPEEVAELVAYLCSPLARFVTERSYQSTAVCRRSMGHWLSPRTCCA